MLIICHQLLKFSFSTLWNSHYTETQHYQQILKQIHKVLFPSLTGIKSSWTAISGSISMNSTYQNLYTFNYLNSLCTFPVSCHLTQPWYIISSHSVWINFPVTTNAVITRMTVQHPLCVWKMTKWLIGFSQPTPITKPRLGFWAFGSSLVAHNARDVQHTDHVRDGF